jgi:carbamoyltransferase
MTTILGLNAFHPDSSAALMVDGQLAAAIEEERLNRVKHCAGFPELAVAKVLEIADLPSDELEHVAIGRDPTANLAEKVAFAASRPHLQSVIENRATNASLVGRVDETVARILKLPAGRRTLRFHQVEHHRAHIASAFFCSPFDEAACLSIDGQGDFASTMMAHGRDTGFEPFGRVLFPHSMGIFYQAATQFLGFPRYGEEWKVMGLAPYGKPTYVEKMRQLVRPLDGGAFELNLEYFRHDKEQVEFRWEEGSPTVGTLWAPTWEKLLGPTRDPKDDFYGKWADIAHSAQIVYEEVFFHILRALHEKTKSDRLCLAGGCALNSVANGKIFEHTPFKEVYVQAAAGDDGTAIGAALYVQHAILGEPRTFVMRDAYTGPAFNDAEIEAAIARRRARDPSAFDGITMSKHDESALCRLTAERINEAKIVGWFQGRMEYGPRALGNRSIVADPRRADMKDILNERIKRRETYRPFAPSVLAERVADVYERSDPTPFMLMVYKTREEWRSRIPAVNHADNSGRVQSVDADVNPLYHKLISAFAKLTGVPLLLNTSFNENEPVVCTPDEGLDCFLRTKMDVLAMGSFMLERTT